MKSATSNNSSRHLVMRLGHLGDVVLTTGLIRHFGERWQCTFDVLTREEWAPLFHNNPHVGRLMGVNKTSLQGLSLWRFFQKLAQEYTNQDVLYDVHGVLRSRLLGQLWRGEVRRYEKMGLERRLFVASQGRFGGVSLRQSSVLQRYAKAFCREEYAEHLLLPHLYVTEDERKKARADITRIVPPFQRKNGTDGNGLVVLHPFATHQNKTWPVQAWKELVTLFESEGIPWIVIGVGPEEQAQVWQGKNSFINKTSLRETMALLEQAQVLVTGDSGPMHLARGVKTQVVGLFGPTVKEWGFFPTDGEGIVLETSQPCRPCSLHGAKLCPRAGVCLTDIALPTVLEAVKSLLPSSS